MNINELFPDASPDDWRMYLEHTLVITNLVTPIPTFVYELNQKTGLVILHDWGNKKTHTIPVSEWDVSLWQPDTGMYSFRRTTLELLRNSMRQNKKGVCPHTFFTRNLFNPILKGVGRLVEFNQYPPFIRKGFIIDDGCRGLLDTIQTSQRFFKLLDAAQKILKRKVFARALSHNFALTSSISPKYICTLWHGDLDVAGVTDNLSIQVTRHPFFQEVFDQFHTETEVTAT